MPEASMDQTKDELHALCEELGLDYSSRDTKEILVDKINEASHFDGPEEFEDDQPEAPKEPKRSSGKNSHQLKKFHSFRRAKS